MLNLLRQLPYFQNRKYMVSAFRLTSYSRVYPFLAKLKYGESTSNDSEKKGYGEKEIFLLQEIDKRLPLPGNTGGIPLLKSYSIRIKKVPRRARGGLEKNMPLPEEKYRSLMAMCANYVADTALSISKKVECVAHECPILLKNDFQNLFPSREYDETLTVLTLRLKTENDMSTWSEKAEEEREILTEYFLIAAKAMTGFFHSKHFWADFVHPNTGKPHSSPLVDGTMFETDLRYRNFGLEIEDLGCCKIISHPIWGTHIFVGAIFTNAPLYSLEVQYAKRKLLYPLLKNF